MDIKTQTGWREPLLGASHTELSSLPPAGTSVAPRVDPVASSLSPRNEGVSGGLTSVVLQTHAVHSSDDLGTALRSASVSPPAPALDSLGGAEAALMAADEAERLSREHQCNVVKGIGTITFCLFMNAIVGSIKDLSQSGKCIIGSIIYGTSIVVATKFFHQKRPMNSREKKIIISGIAISSLLILSGCFFPEEKDAYYNKGSFGFAFQCLGMSVGIVAGGFYPQIAKLVDKRFPPLPPQAAVLN